MAHFNGAVGRLPAFDAVEEVAGVIGGVGLALDGIGSAGLAVGAILLRVLGTVDGAQGWQLAGANLFGYDLEALTLLNKKRPLGAAELQLTAAQVACGAVGVELRERNERAAGIFPDRFHRVGDIAVVVGGIVAADGVDAFWRVLAEGPL